MPPAQGLHNILLLWVSTLKEIAMRRWLGSWLMVLYSFLCRQESLLPNSFHPQCWQANTAEREYHPPATSTIHTESQGEYHTVLLVCCQLCHSITGMAEAGWPTLGFHWHEWAYPEWSTGSPPVQHGTEGSKTPQLGWDRAAHIHGGIEPIDGVWASPELEIISAMQLLFHEGMWCTHMGTDWAPRTHGQEQNTWTT